MLIINFVKYIKYGMFTCLVVMFESIKMIKTGSLHLGDLLKIRMVENNKTFFFVKPT